MGKIKQWMTKQDGLDNLTMTEGEVSTPAKDEVLVEVKSVFLNYRDTECLSLLNLIGGVKMNRLLTGISRYGPLHSSYVGNLARLHWSPAPICAGLLSLSALHHHPPSKLAIA
jgi:hypothetical protein